MEAQLLGHLGRRLLLDRAVGGVGRGVGGVAGGWNFAIDRGGAVTDVIAWNGEGRVRAEKLLSGNPGQYARAPIEGIERILKSEEGALGEVRMGTTVATNALLERKGARVALAITCGFADALRIGYQARPEIFARQIVLPEQPYEAIVEISERVGAEGVPAGLASPTVDAAHAAQVAGEEPDSAAKIRSASDGSFGCSEIANPAGVTGTDPGGASDPIRTPPGRFSVACMILSRQSAGTWSAPGVSPCRNIDSIDPPRERA